MNYLKCSWPINEHLKFNKENYKINVIEITQDSDSLSNVVWGEAEVVKVTDSKCSVHWIEVFKVDIKGCTWNYEIQR